MKLSKQEQLKNYADVIQEAIFVIQGNGAKKEWWNNKNKHYNHHGDDTPLTILKEAMAEMLDRKDLIN